MSVEAYARFLDELYWLVFQHCACRLAEYGRHSSKCGVFGRHAFAAAGESSLGLRPTALNSLGARLWLGKASPSLDAHVAIGIPSPARLPAVPQVAASQPKARPRTRFPKALSRFYRQHLVVSTPARVPSRQAELDGAWASEPLSSDDLEGTDVPSRDDCLLLGLPMSRGGSRGHLPRSTRGITPQRLPTSAPSWGRSRRRERERASGVPLPAMGVAGSCVTHDRLVDIPLGPQR